MWRRRGLICVLLRQAVYTARIHKARNALPLSRKFLAKFVLRMRTNCYFQARAIRISDPDFLKKCNNLAITQKRATSTSGLFDLMTLNICHTWCAPLWDIFTKFERGQSWLITFLLLTRYVTLWSWPLTPRPWTIVVHRVLCDQTLYTKFERNRRIRSLVIAI